MKRIYLFWGVLAFLSLSTGIMGWESRGASRTVAPSPPLATRENLVSKFMKPTDAVKTFFTALKDKDFDLAWESLSSTSQNQFIQSFASHKGVSIAQSKEYFEKNKEMVRDEFWIPLRDRSKIVPLVQDAIYVETDARGNQAMVEMKSGGVTNHIRAVKEGGWWKTGYLESALQDLEKITPATQPMLKQ